MLPAIRTGVRDPPVPTSARQRQVLRLLDLRFPRKGGAPGEEQFRVEQDATHG